MCHSATARPTHGVVVDRAVFVPWNPPTTTRSRTRTGFVFCFSHFAVPCVMRYNSSVVLAGVLDVHFQSRPLCPPCSCPRHPPPDLPTKLVLRVPHSLPGSPANRFCECRRAPPGSARFASARVIWSLSSAVPARVARQALFASAKAPWSSAVPARVADQALFASAKALSPPGRPPSGSPAKLFLRVPRQGRPPSPPNSPAKLFLRVPKRRPRQGRPPSPPGSSAVPARFAR